MGKKINRNALVTLDRIATVWYNDINIERNTMNKWTEIAKDEWKRIDVVFESLMRLHDDSWMLHLPFESHPVSSFSEGVDVYEKLRG